MREPLYGVYGAAGYGREVMPLARALVDRLGLSRERLVFIDDEYDGEQKNGHVVVSYDKFLSMGASSRHVCIAIANSAVREALAAKCSEDGVQMWSIKSDNVIVMDEVDIGHGYVLSPFVTITSNVRIGRCFHANIYSYVAHDCIIGDFVTFAPGVKCNGNVVIEDHAYIGTGAVIRQGRPGRPLVIGRGAVVGMGAVVTKDVPPGVTVVGNPARILEKAK